jgi:hypothetical protein
MLPVHARSIFRYLLRMQVRGAIWVCIEFLLVYLVIATEGNLWFAALAGAVVCAALQAALSLALTFLLVALRVRPEWILAPLFFVGWSALLLSHWPQTIVLLTKTLNTVNPCAWLNSVYLIGWMRGDAQGWFGLLPVSILFATLPFSFRALRQMHYEGVFRVLPRRAGDIFSAPRAERLPGRQDQIDQPAQVLGGSTRPLNWTNHGPVERLIHRMLSPRDRTIAEMLLPAHPRWSNLLLGFMTYFALYLVACTQIHFTSLEMLLSLFLQSSSGAGIAVVASVACLILFVMMLANALFLFTWFGTIEPELNPALASTFAYTTYRLFPVSYWETAKVIAKINSLVALLLLPPTVLFSFTPAYQAVIHDAGRHVAIMPKSLILLWGSSLLLLASKLSPSIQNGLKCWRFTVRTLVVFAGFTGLGCALLVSSNMVIDCALTALCILSALAWFRYSGAQYCKSASSHWLQR